MSNKAAFLTGKGVPLEIGDVEYTHPGDNELLVKVHAVALNPVDWMTRDRGTDLFPTLKFPCILGSDTAGEIVEIGKNVTNFKVGDRVVGHSLGFGLGKPNIGGFQLYTTISDYLTTPIPDSLSYEQASVLPLAVSTATAGLFQSDVLALNSPCVNPKPSGQTVLIWGGSTSVGSMAVQLAVFAGYEVISTSSPKNFEYVKSLGASLVFDYNSKTIVEDLVGSLKGKTLAGAYVISQFDPVINKANADAVVDVVRRSTGNKVISMACHSYKEPVEGVKAVGTTGALVFGDKVTAHKTWGFLPAALASGKFKASPKARVVGHGLESLDGALNLLRDEKVSASKLVVVLD